ncbi:DUF3883 domain-containing protein [Streptomyces sp. NBC_01261]|uniref:DUF3883 domain-containing protein n=1 Tax=unclassified Streptomyces TaxID=2593676 RepID=UPI002E28922E|nr:MULTISPECIES: DUF3883 domain-containing protein [unclassified Streptomyces]
MGNRETEQAAITHVLALERAAGREPRDVRTSGLPYDVDSAPRMIEVKAFSRSARSEPLPLEHRQVLAARANPDRFHLYVVDNLAGPDGTEIGVRVLHGEILRGMIERSQPRMTQQGGEQSLGKEPPPCHDQAVDDLSKVMGWMDVFADLVGPPVSVLLLAEGIQMYRDGGSIGWVVGASVLLLGTLYTLGRRLARYRKRAATPSTSASSSS